MAHRRPLPYYPEPRIVQDAFTFDDLLLVPRRSAALPDEVDTRTLLTARIELNVPLVSAPMDSVTESRLAIALAQEGGIGVIHKNLSIEAQCREVHKVKRSESGVILDPVTLGPDAPLAQAKQIMSLHNISGIPVVDEGHRLVGIITRRDLKFRETPHDQELKVGDVMTSRNLVTGPPDTSLDQAAEILNRAKVEKLLLVDKNNRVAGLITMRDIERSRDYPVSCKDQRGRLRVGAAVGVHEHERIEALIASDVDVIVVDTAHGHSENVLATVQEIRRRHDIDIIAGNIATAEGARDLIDAGVDAIKVGIGPGSICTTRVVSGVGVPQLTAIMDVCRVASPAGVPVIADGGIRWSGDVTKALAAGAHTVMVGSLFAGLDEAPGEVVTWKGRRFKEYRGMGSLGAMVKGSAERYGQRSGTPSGKLVPEGIEGRVPYRGSLSDCVYQLVGGVRSGMGYCGVQTIEALRTEVMFCRITAAGVVESHPHDVAIMKESPNYAMEVPDD
ncbi:MAG TPA: IMP dehydrogenase [Phycisphaerae bacterium]|nr:IMP dehydrogenase [Phycisphaerae bacterium]HNU45817.1 IMP dehydrogenase [Phycisphaerae bacterium]